MFYPTLTHTVSYYPGPPCPIPFYLIVSDPSYPHHVLSYPYPHCLILPWPTMSHTILPHSVPFPAHSLCHLPSCPIFRMPAAMFMFHWPISYSTLSYLTPFTIFHAILLYHFLPHTIFSHSSHLILHHPVIPSHSSHPILHCHPIPLLSSHPIWRLNKNILYGMDFLKARSPPKV